MLRDPVKALASVIDVCGTLFWMRCDEPFSGDSYGHFLSADPVVANLERMIGWLEEGVIPAERVQPVRYLEFFADPAAALETLYRGLDIALTPEALAAMQGYIASKPKGKFGEHDYDLGAETTRAEERDKFRKFQKYFGVESEV